MRRIHAVVLPLAVLALVGMSSDSWADIINFEDVAVTTGTLTTEGDVTSGGFLFDSATNHNHRVNNSSSPNFAANGTTFLSTDHFAGSTSLRMTSVTGGLFSLGSIDFSEGWVSEMASSIRVTGDSVGGPLAMTVTMDGVNDGVGSLVDFETVSFNWGGLRSVTFTAVSGAGDQYFGIDNISTPEPGTLALLGIGLAGVVVLRRRRKTAA